MINTAKVPNGAFRHKRMIEGVRVLVRAEPDGNGITPESFLVRFLLPSGKVDRFIDGHFFWQAFNEAKKMLRTIKIGTE